jgi:hypothetical protein
MRSMRRGDYEIYEDGTIISYVRSIEGRPLKHNLNRGYYTVELNGKEHKVHRLLAECFIPNPDNLPMVNHKDGVKTNISIDNLEWSTARDNVLHAYANGLCPKYKGPRVDNRKVNQYTRDGKLIATYNSITEAAKAVTDNVASGCSKISTVCSGRLNGDYVLKTYKNYKWSYAD